MSSRSARMTASIGSWVTSTRAPTNRPSTARRCRRVSTRVCTSSAASGSSRRSSVGSVASARASATRCACPPESSPGRAAWSTSTPTSVEQRVRPLARGRSSDAALAQSERDVVERARGARRGGSPGTRRRPSAARAGRTCRSRVRRRPGRRWRCGRRRWRAVRTAPAAASSCPSRSGRARRAARRRRPASSTSSEKLPSATRMLGVDAHDAGQPAVHAHEHDERHDHQDQAEHDRGVRVRAFERDVHEQRQRLRLALRVARERDRGAELAQRTRPAQHRAGDQRGPDHRQRHPPEHAEPRRAERAGRIFETLVGGPERGLDRQHEERHRHERLGDDRARDVEREVHADVVEVLADEPVSAEREEQRDAADDGWQHHRQQRDRAHDAATRIRDARLHPRQRHAEHDGDRRRRDRRLEREPQRRSRFVRSTSTFHDDDHGARHTSPASGTTKNSAATAAPTATTAGTRDADPRARAVGAGRLMVNSAPGSLSPARPAVRSRSRPRRRTPPRPSGASTP